MTNARYSVAICVERSLRATTLFAGPAVGAGEIKFEEAAAASPSGKRTNQRARPAIGTSSIATATNRTVAEATTSDGMVLPAMAAEPRPLGETR
jgi:hypothetical protein